MNMNAASDIPSTTPPAVSLDEVIEAIKQHATRFQMHAFFSISDDDFKTFIDGEECGCGACIGGFAIAIHYVKSGDSFSLHTARTRSMNSTPDAKLHADQLLGLDRRERKRLFQTLHWPTEFREAYYAATSREERATIAIRRIEHFKKHRR